MTDPYFDKACPKQQGRTEGQLASFTESLNSSIISDAGAGVAGVRT